MAFPVDAIANDFQIFYSSGLPRAHPGVPISWRADYYEKDNRGIAWTLTNAPVGMSVSSDGTLLWPVPVLGTYNGIILTARRAAWDAVNYPGSGLTTTLTFNMVVSTTDFIFVATAASVPAGNDANPGTIASPKLTIPNALTTAGVNGKTIVVRAGTYPVTLAAQVGAGTNYTAANYLCLMAYPGEVVDVVHTNFGFEVETSQHIVFANLSVTGATHLEGGQISLKGTNCVAKDCECFGSAWDANSNCTGMLLGGVSNVINRCVAFDNVGVSGNPNNNSNYLIYNDDIGGVKWLMNSKGYDSNFNVKIKHTNSDNSKVIVHNVENVGCGFIGFGKNSSVRFNVVWESGQRGIYLGLTDPSAFTVLGMFVEHNTVISSVNADESFGIQDGYGTTGTVTFYKNILYQSHGAAGAGNDGRKMMQNWQFTQPLLTARALPYNGDCNLFHNTVNLDTAWIVGTNGISPQVLNFAGYQALTGVGITRDPNSITLDPAFGNVGAGDLTIQDTSPAATSACSDYIGAFRPEQAYGTVGVTDSSLLEWAGAPPGPAPTQRLVRCSCG